MNNIKIGEGSKIVDITTDKILGCLFKNEDGKVYFRQNPLHEGLSDLELNTIKQILGEVNSCTN